MIHVTRLNGSEFVINGDMIREVEATPDTVITLNTGQKIMVREAVDEVVAAVIEYKRRIQGIVGSETP
ncbi:MAG TPA: flagellar FlbD family protein [Candidatus Hydrogenedentes bacterium]|nr:flagellar FlbD family protein [Candidatus Hydrogenedentota bacterium]HIJ74528.1 flagellar FlbD family protein [Candidatus Hydrogenedentota bacterium]